MNTFVDFWNQYPRKVSKRDALKAWEKAVRVESPEAIIAGLIRQIPYLNSRPMEFRPHPATWLNGWRWEDEVQAPVSPHPHRERTILDAIDERLERKNGNLFDVFRTIDAEPAGSNPPPDLRLVADASRR